MKTTYMIAIAVVVIVIIIGSVFAYTYLSSNSSKTSPTPSPTPTATLTQLHLPPHPRQPTQQLNQPQRQPLLPLQLLLQLPSNNSAIDPDYWGLEVHLSPL